MKLKDKYYIEKISLHTAKILLDKYHYLHEHGNFRSGLNFGLFDSIDKKLIGVCVFHSVSAKGIAKGCFGLNSYKLEGFMELGRLCINPHKYEKNMTSFFLSGSIRLLRKYKKVVALLTYADSEYHTGYVYQACSFKYYGLTAQKKDFFVLQQDGSYKKLQRGKCKHLKGEWRDKSRKHRYLIIYDKGLKTLWEEHPYPKQKQIAQFNYNESKKDKQEFIPKESRQYKLL